MGTRTPNIGHVPELTFCPAAGKESYGQAIRRNATQLKLCVTIL